ncbi:MAG: hypothetical protein ACFE8A_12190 [Candidatus Hodarchaeota archaeon]
MRKLAISIAMLLLGSIIISFLIPPNFNNMTISTSEQKSPTQENITPDQISPIQDDILPKLSAPAGVFNQTFNITQSEDDASSHRFTLAQPITRHDATNITLGVADKDAPSPDFYFSTALALRWNITVPKYAHITKAYINLTVTNLTYWGEPWTGLNTSISAFNQATTNDFSVGTENLWDRPQIGDLNWELDGTESINQTIQSINIASLIEQIIILDGWDGKFGAFIKAGVGTTWLEAIQFWAYDFGKPEYYPKLFVEWDYSPRFISIPANLTVNNQTLGYHLDWTAVDQDNNPTIYTIFGNETIGESTKQVQSGTWTSGVVIRYDMPRINIENYPFVIVKYNITIYDDDGKFNWNVVDINVTDKGLPTIDVKFVQEDKEFSYEKQNYFETDKGPFTIQIYNKTPINPVVTFSAYYPLNRLNIWSGLMLLGFIPAVGNIFCTERTYGPAYCIEDWALSIQWGTEGIPPAYAWTPLDFNYTDAAGCWQLTPTVGLESGRFALNHTFQLAIYLPILPALSIYEYYGFPIQDLLYGLTNYININLGGEFIYLNQTVSTVKGGMWDPLNFSMLNKDTSPPFFCEPIFNEPKEPDLHYEIRILVYTEEHGADIDEVYLYYNIDDGAWKRTEMALQYGNYYGEIPPQEGGAKITYYIEMVDIEGNIIATDEYEETAVTFEGPSPLVPILGVLLAFLGALSLVVILRYRSKRAFKKASAEKLIKKPKKGVIEKE